MPVNVKYSKRKSAISRMLLFSVCQGQSRVVLVDSLVLYLKKKKKIALDIFFDLHKQRLFTGLHCPKEMSTAEKQVWFWLLETLYITALLSTFTNSSVWHLTY